MLSFKTWSADRTKKEAILVQESENLLPTVIREGSAKLNTVGVKLVLEADGTDIDEEQLLRHFQSQPLLLLNENEEWYKLNTCDDATPPITQQQNEGTDAITQYRLLSLEGLAPEPLPEGLNENIPNKELQNGDAEKENTDIAHFLQERRNSFTSWDEYKVPWDRLTASDLVQLQAGSRKETLRSSVVQTIVGEMRLHDTNLPDSVFSGIAIQCLQKYPETFEDRKDDGTRLGRGFEFTFKKLKEHQHYLERPHKRNSQLGLKLHIPLKSRKVLKSVQAGTIEWQPESVPPNETSESVEEKRLAINETVLQDVLHDEATQKNFVNDLEVTYGELRLFLNNMDNLPDVHSIRLKWPILLNKEVMFWHTRKLTGQDIEVFNDCFGDKFRKILIFGVYKHRLDINLESTDNEEISRWVLNVLKIHFQEETNNFIPTCDVSVLYFCIIFILHSLVYCLKSYISSSSLIALRETLRLKFM